MTARRSSLRPARSSLAAHNIAQGIRKCRKDSKTTELMTITDLAPDYQVPEAYQQIMVSPFQLAMKGEMYSTKVCERGA